LSVYKNSLEDYLESLEKFWKSSGIYGEQHSGNPVFSCFSALTLVE